MNHGDYDIQQTVELLRAAFTAWRLDVEVHLVSDNSCRVSQTDNDSYLVCHAHGDAPASGDLPATGANGVPTEACAGLLAPLASGWVISDQHQVVDSAGSLAGLLLALRHLLDDQFRPGRAIIGLRAPDAV